ncbi:IclR family transcriptional regulator [Dactylosporangium fulvum]|uniref:IclR family transcriptional regulator n=1 Tax=Dactylosporangium fulvum TaxID=53359 RepID=A0ABY5WCL5_9ACTN|nr:IclR family transcriptional regulator [Dactylosporangium fulvum]UWP86789.1 IclR family transcriptional regulator [Dactylosporangium fulvum]
MRYIVESAQDPTSARRIAAEIGMPSTTVHRALSSLVAVGMLAHNPTTQLYELGPALHRMARLVTARHPLSDLVVPYLQNLTQLTGETSHIGQYDQSRHEMMFISQVQGSRALRYVVPLHSWVPLYLGASGLAILAFLDGDSQNLVIERASKELGGKVTGLRERLAEVRLKGYAISHGQRLPGAVGIAAPLRGAGSSVIGDVVLTIPEVQFDEAKTDEYARLVMECAQEITTALGGPADQDGSPRTSIEEPEE